MNHGKEVGGELVVASGNATEVLQLGEETLYEIALAVETLAEAGLLASVALWGDVGRGTLLLDPFADAVGVIGLVSQHDGARAKMIEKRIGDLPVMRLSSSQTKPDREPLRVDDNMDLGREPAA